MSSPVPELLVQESLCTDLFKTISESIEASDHVDPDTSSVQGQGDIIGQLLDRMIQILPPEERNIFGAADDKNIEEIIEEANELIQATTPLFSSTDSGEKSWNKTSKALSKTSKSSELSNKKDNSERAVATRKSESGTSSICSSLESIVVRDSYSHETSESRLAGSHMQQSESSSKLDKATDNFFRQDKFTVNPSEIQSEEINKMASTNSELENIPSKFTRRLDDDLSNNTRNAASTKEKEQKSSDKENNSGSENVKPAEVEVEQNEKSSLNLLRNGHKDPESQLEAVRQKFITEIQELKLAHNKEMYGLTKQITSLNDKIFKLQKHSKIEQSPDLKTQEIERLENEIKSQEQLLAGYERENKKLCKEISTLKESWKQRESKLLEDKQRLQNELQGMVSKITTEALEEQVKDARETIVKLQIELTTYKSKNKELEGICDRLREQTHSLQKELSNCHCDRTGSRRDKYSLLASSNVSSQIQDLKNVITRKDMEIAQMNTTLSILKGELSSRDLNLPMTYSMEDQSQQLELTVSQLQTSLAVERQNYKDLAREKDLMLKENLDLKRQVRELESIVKRRQRSDSCFPVNIPDPQMSSRLLQLEKELSVRQESLSTLHEQFLNMQKKYEDHIQDLENQLKERRGEIQTLKVNSRKEETNLKSSVKKIKQQSVVKEETHLLATIRGLRHEVTVKEKDISKLTKEMEELRQTNRKLQKEREKQLNAIPTRMAHLREKPGLKKMDKTNSITSSRNSVMSPNNNLDPILFTELQESNLILKSKTKSLQEEVKRLEQDLIAMHNKRVHDLNMLQSEHELDTARLVEERAALMSQSSTSELQGQVYTQQMVINHLKNRLKQMEELKNEVTLLRAERDHLEQRLGVVNKEMCFLQNAHSPESIQYKTLLEKLETLEKNQEIREQKLNAVRELLSRTTQGQGQCSGTCRDKLLDKNRQICYYRAQMDRILEALLEIRRTK